MTEDEEVFSFFFFLFFSFLLFFFMLKKIKYQISELLNAVQESNELEYLTQPKGKEDKQTINIDFSLIYFIHFVKIYT